MAQGDTTVRIDFETGGASSARMTVQDVYRSAEQTLKGANMRMLTEEQKRAKSVIELDKQRQKYRRQNAMKEFQDQENERKKQLDSVASLAKQRGEWMLKNYNEEQAELKRNNRIRLAEEKRALRESLREKKMALKEQERMQKMQEAQATNFDKLATRGVWGAVMGIAGYAGASGISSMLSGIAEGMQNVIAKRTELEDAITPIVMLEDNVSRMGAIRQEVSSTAVSLGRSYQEVGQFYSDLVGSTGNLGAAERESLIKETKELAQLTGGSLVTAQNLLTKSYQIYGKELVNVNQLQNKLMVTQDQGSITFEDMALRLPELLQAGKSVGMNIDEVLGTVIGATRQSGSIEKTMTGMRNFFLIINDAESKGIKLTGDYTHKLAQLDTMFKTNRKGMEDLFGREVVVHAAGVAGAFGDVSKAIQDVGAVAADTDAVFDKLLKKASDTAFQQVQTLKIYDAAQKNAPNIAADLGAGGGIWEKLTAGKTNAEISTGGYLTGWLSSLIGGAGALFHPGYAQEGRDMAYQNVYGANFVAYERSQFFKKKEQDLFALKNFQYGGPQSDQYKAKMQEVSNRQLSPHLMTDEERRIYRETGKAPQSAEVTVATSLSQDKYLSALDRNTEAILSMQRTSASSAKPGGSKTNAEETL